jgi:hypothetical protein
MRRSMRAALMFVMFCPILPLKAQRPISIGLGGGVSIPEGDLRDGVNTGWHALGTVALSTLMQPLGLRLDVAYNRLAFTDEAAAALGEEGSQSVGSATLNATYRLPMTRSALSPYIISGLGAYRTECSIASGCDASTRYGWNVGLGTKLYFLGARSFLEARYHRTERGDANVHYFPVTFGLLF